MDFNNQIETDSLSILSFHYLYNGGGVGIADFNNDGYKDIFLGGNLVSSKLFSGAPNLDFKDVTREAGLETTDWINGISIVDINNDGKSDIYLSVGGASCGEESCENLLFINKGEKGTFVFEESAQTFGLNIEGYSQQALFFDADLDGDLDMYQLQNFVDKKSKNYPQAQRYFSKESYDRFFINMEQETGTLKFEDRSDSWNVRAPGFGLGIALSDFNKDGYPDLYIANDFITDDIIYINEKGKGFTNKSNTLLKHTTYNSMGVDVADINNDQFEDVLVVDMLPSDNERQKTMLGAMNYDKFLLSQNENYNAQYIRNTVQVSNGINENKEANPFTDLGTYYNLHQTDWSWSPLIADFDNDTDADVFISNGYGKNITDLDFINYTASLPGFGGKEKAIREMQKKIDEMPAVELSNHLFVREEGGDFSNYTNFEKSITNGVAYGDLDNDGDLDLVLNNINQKAKVLLNNSKNNYLKVHLEGASSNRDAIGAEIRLELSSGKSIVRTHSPVRSYLSCMDNTMVFGLGQDSLVQLQVKWPDGSYARLDDLKANTEITVVHGENYFTFIPREKEQLFTQEKVAENQTESDLRAHDFSLQPLLLKACLEENVVLKASKLSSDIYVGNLNNEIAIYRGGKEESTLGLMQLEGLVVTDFLVHLNNSKEQLVVAAYEKKGDAAFLILLERIADRLQLISKVLLPKGSYQMDFLESNQTESTLVLVQYPTARFYPKSNGSSVHFYTLKEKEFIPKLMEFEQDAHRLTDINCLSLEATDEQKHLVITGEWMQPIIGTFEEERFVPCDLSSMEALSGMWQTVKACDLDNDGDLDLLLGNWGTNTRHTASVQKPLRMVSTDLDGNGSLDPLVSHFNIHDDKDFSYHSRDDIAKQLPGIKATYTDYHSFATASFDDLVSTFQSEANMVTINNLESVILENKGNCAFQMRKLPEECQYSVINAFEFYDFDGDGWKDLVALTNCQEVETHNGKVDGLNGLVLLNKGEFEFEALSPKASGINIGEVGQDLILRDELFLISSNEGLYKFSLKQ